MTDLKKECDELKALASAPRQPESFRRAKEALNSKFESIQVEGAKALAAWGGRDAVAALREWLSHCLEKPCGWSLRGVAARSLAQCISSEDTDWVLDFYFSQSEPFKRAEVLPLASAVPVPNALERIALELLSSDSARNQAARILQNRLRALGLSN